jgi:hypothetical protein
MSQLGMVAHWRRVGGAHARRSQLLNGAGALATGLTLIVVLASKFMECAWISVLLIAGMVILLRRIRRHYDFIAQATRLDLPLVLGPARPPIVVLPLRRWRGRSGAALGRASSP